MSESQVDRLRSRLEQDDEAFLKELEEGRGPFSMLGLTFQGPMAAITYAAGAFILVFLGLMIWTAWQALRADSDRAAILWSTAFIACLIPFGFLRLWFWIRANHLVMMRELKKLELRVLRMSKEH